MTTLPQTTGGTLRLPRNRANAQPQLPGPAANPATATTTGVGAMSASDVLRVLRSNLWFILLALAVSAAIGIGAHYYLLRHHTSYTATGLIQIQNNQMLDPLDVLKLSRDERHSLEVEQQTQAALLRDDSLWTDILQNANSPIRQTEWFRSFLVRSSTTGEESADIAEAKKSLARRLGVAPMQNTVMIRLSMTTASPEDARIIVQNLGDQHVERQQSQTRNRNYNSAQLLEANRRQLTGRIDQLQRRVSERRSRLGEGGEKAGFGSRSIKETEISQFVRDKGLAMLEMESARSAYESLVQQVQNGVDPPTVELATEVDPMVQRYRQMYENSDLLLKVRARNLHPNHPSLRDLIQERDEVQSLLEQRVAEVKSTARDRMLRETRSEFDNARARHDLLDSQLNEARGDLNELTASLAELLTDQEQLELLRTSLKRIEDQIAAINLSSTQQADLGSVRWAAQPRTPDSRSFPHLPTIMAGAVLLGLGLSLGIAFLRELADTSVRSPRDIARVGQMNLLGMIPHEDEDVQSGGVPLALAIARAPQGIIAEQFRQVRTRLHQTAGGLDTTRSILVTSPSPGDGKTVVACNLAAGLALNGRKILLVDANFRRPTLHEVFGLADNTTGGGFAAVLKGTDALETAAHTTDIPNLDVLQTGQRPSNPTELLESSLLNDFIDRALEDYDHVIFDSGPILFVSETVALVPRVDGVLTVVMARSNSRGLLGRMRDSLRQLRAEHLGVVLNGVRAQAGGYYNRNIKTYYAYQQNDGPAN